MRVTFPFEITKFFDTKIDIETGKREIILKKNYAFAVEENFKAIKKYFNDLINTDNIIPQGLNANIVIEPFSFNADELVEPYTIGSLLFKEGAIQEALGITPWTNWTPTYSATGGMTYTGVTSVVAKYFVIGKVCFFVLMCIGTTGGSSSDAIQVTLPIATKEDATHVGGGCHIHDSVRMSGSYYTDLTTRIRVFRYNSSNWNIGSNKRIHINGFYEID